MKIGQFQNILLVKWINSNGAKSNVCSNAELVNFLVLLGSYSCESDKLDVGNLRKVTRHTDRDWLPHNYMI